MTARTHYYYLRLPVKDLQRLVEAHIEEFETVVGDSFTEEELKLHEKLLDDLASVVVQPILSELSFDDFYPNPKEEEKQRQFFESCQSSICLDNLPYFESNPFQITYLIDLLWSLDEVLIDRGGVSELVFKREYIDELKKFKTMEVLLPVEKEKPIVVTTKRPVNPIDFTIQDVYKELAAVLAMGIEIPIAEQSEKLQKIYAAVISEKDLDADALLKRSTLIPKDFGDNLERLKFFLKKVKSSSLQ
jgi:hypothetical protein